jgi:hypothetical protein
MPSCTGSTCTSLPSFGTFILKQFLLARFSLRKALRYIQACGGLLSFYADPDPKNFNPDHDSGVKKKMKVLLMRGKIQIFHIEDV